MRSGMEWNCKKKLNHKDLQVLKDVMNRDTVNWFKKHGQHTLKLRISLSNVSVCKVRVFILLGTSLV